MDLGASNYVEQHEAGARAEFRSPDPTKNPTGLFYTTMGIAAEPMRKRARELQREQLTKAVDQERPWGEYSEIEMACTGLLSFEGGTGTVTTVDDLRKFLRTHRDGFWYARQIVITAESVSVSFTEPPSN